MRKGFRFGPGLLRLMIALLALAGIAVAVKEMPSLRRRRKPGKAERKSARRSA
jgi:hypothetical protein